MPKMKEIQKVVKNLSREQESAARSGGGGGVGRRTNRYKNIPVNRGDLMTEKANVLLFYKIQHNKYQ